MTYKEIEDFIKNNNIKSRKELRKNSRKAYDSFYTLTDEERDCLLPLLKSNDMRTDLVTVDDFRSFIVTENIASRRDLRKRSGNVNTRFMKFLTKEEQDSILPPKIRPLYVGLKTVDDFKKFVAENSIRNRRDFSSRFPAAYYKFLKFTEAEKDEILSNTYKDWSSINTKEEIKEFIKENNIQCRNELNLRFSQISKKFLALSEQDKDELLPLTLNYYSDIKTKDDIKKVIDDNNIQGRKELSDKFQIVYNKFLTILTEEERDELLPSTAFNYFHLNTKEDFKKFIIDNGIVSRKDFYNRFRQAYYRFLKLFDDTAKDELLPSVAVKYSSLNTKKDFEEFIKDNNITSRNDLKMRFRWPYKKFSELLTDEEKEEILPTTINDYSFLKTKDDFQKFIKENNITGRNEFLYRFSGAYYRFIHTLPEEDTREILPRVYSTGEIFLSELFEHNNIKFVKEKTFEDLINISKLRYDFYLVDYNILVEYHGSQHFDTDCNMYSESGLMRDKMKYDYAVGHGITILYYTNERSTYEKYGYFTEVITDANILIQKIKDIGLTTQ